MVDSLHALHPETDPLGERVAGHRFDDPGAALCFSRRLARENGWGHGRALRVIEEYRRFA